MLSSLHVRDYTPDRSRSTASPIIILIHGGASSNRMYDEVGPLLARKGFHVHVPDLPGHGQTAVLARAPLSQTPEHLSHFTFPSATASLKDDIHALKQAHQFDPIVLVGISLGGQVVLDFLSKNPDLISAAIVSGASIHPQDEKASWEMPRLPTEDERWMTILKEDVEAMGMENAQNVQDTSFGFTFEIAPQRWNGKFPPTLVLVGENDVAMAKRDFGELVAKVKMANEKSEGLILEGLWHNHSIDAPDSFATIVGDWVQKFMR